MSRAALVADIKNIWADKTDTGWEIAQDIVAEMGFDALSDQAITELARRCRIEQFLFESGGIPHSNQPLLEL